MVKESNGEWKCVIGVSSTEVVSDKWQKTKAYKWNGIQSGKRKADDNKKTCSSKYGLIGDIKKDTLTTTTTITSCRWQWRLTNSILENPKRI